MSSSSDEEGQLLTNAQLSLFTSVSDLDGVQFEAESETEGRQLTNADLDMFLQPSSIANDDPLFWLPDPLQCNQIQLDELARSYVTDTRRVKSPATRPVRDRQRYAERNMLYEIAEAKKKGTLRAEVISRMEIIAAQTREGAKAFPELANLTAAAQQNAAFVRSSALALAELGSATRKNMCRLVLQDIPNAFVKSKLLMSAGQVKYIRDNRKRAIDEENARRQDLVNQKMLLGIKRKKVTDPEARALELFFLETTSVLSGSSTLTRNLDMSVLDWKFELFARYPRYLYALGCAQPQLLEQEPNTKFLREMRASSALYSQADFDPETHVDLRRSHAYSTYIEKQHNKKGSTAPPIPQLTDGIKGVEYDTYLGVVERLGYKWTKFVSPYPCTLCDHFVIYERRFEQICALISAQVSTNGEAEDSVEFKALCRQKRFVFEKLNECRLHILQVVACRAEAEKMRDSQLPGSVFVTRDYVNHHDVSGLY